MTVPIKLYDSQDQIPEAQRAAAIETKDGKFAVSEDDAALGEKGERALEAAKKAAKDAEKAQKEAERKLAELERDKKARESGVSEEALQKIRDDEALARKPIEDENATLKAENRKLKLTDRVQALFLQHGGMPDRVEDAMLSLDLRTDLGDEGGIVFKGKDGKVTADTAETFFGKFKTEKPWLFKGSGSRGSGMRGSDGNSEDAPPTNAHAFENKRREIAGSF